MINKELRDLLEELEEGGEDLGRVFDNPSFDNSIIGTTEDGLFVYDYDKMVEELMEDDNIGREEAEDFISYNTVRALPYFDRAPIIVYRLMI